MISILFHIDSLVCGGAEKVLCNLVNNMDLECFDITVYTLFPAKNRDYISNKIKLKSIYPMDNAFFRICYRIEAFAGLVYKLHIKPEYDLEIAYLECGPTKVIASSSSKKAKKIAWIHTEIEKCFDKSFVNKSRKWYKKYDAVVCVSEQVRDSYIKNFGNYPKTFVLHNVIDSKYIEKKSKEELPSNFKKTKTIILTVGRLVAQKNPLRILRIHKKLIENGIENELWFVGSGELESILRKEIELLGLTKTVKLFGYKSNPYPYMVAADILVCSSNVEGYSTFIVEGLILGKPIVTTNCSGMHEILGDSKYGIISENSDEDLYRKIYDLLSDKNGMLKELEKASSIRGKEFDVNKIVNENEIFFKQILKAND